MGGSAPGCQHVGLFSRGQVQGGFLRLCGKAVAAVAFEAKAVRRDLVPKLVNQQLRLGFCQLQVLQRRVVRTCAQSLSKL